MNPANLPARAFLHEEGPREGFQSEPPIPLADKLRLIDALAATGLAQVNCASFVDVRKVPQMADAEALAAAIERRPGVRYTGIWLNRRGFERALASGLDLVPNVVCTVSDTLSRRNNGCSSADLLARQADMLEAYRVAGHELAAAHVFTAFGCNDEGTFTPERTLQGLRALLSVCADAGMLPPLVYFCDTVGVAHPALVTALLDQAHSAYPDLAFGLHLHDTRGMGLANALAGLAQGVTHFDSSIGGLGGCPFAGNTGAAGNVCTEDLALMCEEMGVATGLDLEALVECARLAEAIVGHPLPGRVMKVARARMQPAP